MLRLQNIPGDRTLWCRHELKYVVSEAQAAAIARYIGPYMKLDRHSEFKENNAYPICSLYFDSDKFQLCRETLEGKKNRFKLRIRSYSNEADTPCFFEIKRRVNRIIIKSRTRVLRHGVVPLLNGTAGPQGGNTTEDEALEQFLFYKTAINAAPVVRVRYLRQAYESFIDDSVRITIDRQLQTNITQTPDISLDGPGWNRVPINGPILEIKFTGRYPSWLSRMIECFGADQRSVSKYAMCLQQGCLLGYCGPKRRTPANGQRAAVGAIA